WVSRHFGYNPSFEQLDIIVLTQDARLNQAVILVDREPADRQRRHNGRKRRSDRKWRSGRMRRQGGDCGHRGLSLHFVGISNHSPGWRMTGCAGVSFVTRAAQAWASCTMGGNVL